MSRTAEQLSEIQSAAREIPASERLLGATLLSSTFDVNSTTLSGAILLTSFDREQAMANISL